MPEVAAQSLPTSVGVGMGAAIWMLSGVKRATLHSEGKGNGLSRAWPEASIVPWLSIPGGRGKNVLNSFIMSFGAEIKSPRWHPNTTFFYFYLNPERQVSYQCICTNQAAMVSKQKAHWAVGLQEPHALLPHWTHNGFLGRGPVALVELTLEQ